jgi:hypothetical protein
MAITSKLVQINFLKLDMYIDIIWFTQGLEKVKKDISQNIGRILRKGIGRQKITQFRQVHQVQLFIRDQEVGDMNIIAMEIKFIFQAKRKLAIIQVENRIHQQEQNHIHQAKVNLIHRVKVNLILHQGENKPRLFGVF